MWHCFVPLGVQFGGYEYPIFPHARSTILPTGLGPMYATDMEFPKSVAGPRADEISFHRVGMPCISLQIQLCQPPSLANGILTSLGDH